MTALLDRLARLGDWLLNLPVLGWARQQPWWPTRKWWTGTLTMAAAFVALKLGFDVNDPWVAGGISYVVGKALEWLVPDREREPARSHRRARAKARERIRRDLSR